MQLYYCETTNPRKTCALAKHLELPLEYIRVDVFGGEQRQPDFGNVNPNRKVPVLVDGEVTVFESTAIMMHMCNVAGSDMWPAAPASQVAVIQWLAWDMNHLSRHASTVYFEHYIRDKASLGKPNRAAVEEAVGFFRNFAAVLDAHLAAKTHIVDDRLTIADFGVGCVMTIARELRLKQLPVEEYANVAAWLDRLSDVPAWRDPWPER